MTEVLFTNSVARGRNGWFQMVGASFFVEGRRVVVNIVSKRRTYPGPIFLDLMPEDAAALGRELLRKAGLEPSPDRRTAVTQSRRRRQTRA
jgi:hypothetical protein